MARKLPTPATSGEMFMNAAVEELQKLNNNLEQLIKKALSEPVQAQSDEVPLKEPQSKPAHRDAKKKG